MMTWVKGHINICLRNKNLAMQWGIGYQSVMKYGIWELP